MTLLPFLHHNYFSFIQRNLHLEQVGFVDVTKHFSPAAHAVFESGLTYCFDILL